MLSSRGIRANFYNQYFHHLILLLNQIKKSFLFLHFFTLNQTSWEKIKIIFYPHIFIFFSLLKKSEEGYEIFAQTQIHNKPINLVGQIKRFPLLFEFALVFWFFYFYFLFFLMKCPSIQKYLIKILTCYYFFYLIGA